MGFDWMLAAIMLNSLALGYVALHDYRSGKSEALCENTNSYFAAYFITTIIAFLLIFVLPFKTGQANPNDHALLLAIVPLLLAFIYIYCKISNNGKLAFVLFLLSLAQQAWYALGAQYPRQVLFELVVAYVAGIFIIFGSAIYIGRFLAAAWPEAEKQHQIWAKSQLASRAKGKNIGKEFILAYKRVGEEPGQTARNMAGFIIAYSIANAFIYLMIYSS